MAKEFTQNIIGIEINEEFIFLSQVDQENDTYVITKFKQINMPPRAIIDGILADPENIADQIAAALEESEFNASNVIVALNTNIFIKKTTITKPTNSNETEIMLNNICQTSPILANKDYQVSFQKYSPNKKKEEKETKETDSDEKEKTNEKEKQKDIILYAAVPNDIVDNIEDLAKSLDMNLVSIDLLSLGTLRALQWQTKKEKNPKLLISCDYNFIDINIIYKHHVLLSQTTRTPISVIEEETLMLEAYTTTIKQIFLEFSNHYPELPTPTEGLFHSRTIDPTALINTLSKDLNIAINKHDITTSLTFKTTEIKPEKIPQLNNLFLPSIGLALKFYEPINKTLSLTKIKKQLAPIFNKNILVRQAVLFSIIIGTIITINILITTRVKSTTKKLDFTKNQIRIVQSGNKSKKATQLGSLRKKLTFFETIHTAEQESKYQLFHELISFLPNDMTFTSFNINKDKTVSIKGESYLKDSIYSFYAELQKNHKNVKLSKISTEKRKKLSLNKFSIDFTWVKK